MVDFVSRTRSYFRSMIIAKKDSSKPTKERNPDGNKEASSESSTKPDSCKDESETFLLDFLGSGNRLINEYYNSLVAHGYSVEIEHIDNAHVRIIGRYHH